MTTKEEKEYVRSVQERVEDEQRGFTQGVAWAIAALTRYPIGPGGLLKESGIPYRDFKSCGADPNDLRAIRELCKLEGISLR